MTNEEIVTRFHSVMGTEINEDLTDTSEDLLRLRIGLLSEEIAEALFELNFYQEHMTEIINTNNHHEALEAIFKELGDLQYVLSGLFVTYGIPIDHIMEEIHMSNLTKLDDEGKPVYRSDGKILKGINYQPADMRPLVATYLESHA